MKIAILSDIHGNTLALDAVLADVKSKGCEKILILGDLAMAGYNPNGAIETIRMLMHPSSKIPTKAIFGNTDIMITQYSEEGFQKVLNIYPCMAYVLKEDVKIIRDVNVEFLNYLPKYLQLEIDDIRIFCCHGSPRKIDENIRPETPIEEVEEMVESVDSDIIFCGHTHVPCAFQLESGKTVVNVGSVGRPMTPDKRACYVILETFENAEYYIEHQLVSYDNLTVAKKIRERNYEECEVIAKMFEE